MLRRRRRRSADRAARSRPPGRTGSRAPSRPGPARAVPRTRRSPASARAPRRRGARTGRSSYAPERASRRSTARTDVEQLASQLAVLVSELRVRVALDRVGSLVDVTGQRLGAQQVLVGQPQLPAGVGPGPAAPRPDHQQHRPAPQRRSVHDHLRTIDACRVVQLGSLPDHLARPGGRRARSRSARRGTVESRPGPSAVQPLSRARAVPAGWCGWRRRRGRPAGRRSALRLPDSDDSMSADGGPAGSARSKSRDSGTPAASSPMTWPRRGGLAATSRGRAPRSGRGRQRWSRWGWSDRRRSVTAGSLGRVADPRGRSVGDLHPCHSVRAPKILERFSGTSFTGVIHPYGAAPDGPTSRRRSPRHRSRHRPSRSRRVVPLQLSVP